MNIATGMRTFRATTISMTCCADAGHAISSASNTTILRIAIPSGGRNDSLPWSIKGQRRPPIRRRSSCVHPSWKSIAPFRQHVSISALAAQVQLFEHSPLPCGAATVGMHAELLLPGQLLFRHVRVAVPGERPGIAGQHHLLAEVDLAVEAPGYPASELVPALVVTDDLPARHHLLQVIRGFGAGVPTVLADLLALGGVDAGHAADPVAIGDDSLCN